MTIATRASPCHYGDPISGRFVVLSSTRRLANAPDRRPFVTGELRNREQTIKFIGGRSTRDGDDAPLGVDDLLALLAPGSFVGVEGILQSYQGEGQICLARVWLVPDDQIDPADYLPTSKVPCEDLHTEYVVTVLALRPPWRSVVERVIDPIFQQFATWPAAKMLHHAWVGGLIEHSLEVAQVARRVAVTWPTVDADLVAAAALLHDVGKIDQFGMSADFSETDRGRVVGHVYSGLRRVDEACEVLGLADFDANRLRHCIASHHGLLEHGALTRPCTLEAIILHYADELSAKLAMINRAIDEAPEERDWLERVPGLDGPVWVAAARAVRSDE
jgi:3'-5' exoribonuclease